MKICIAGLIAYETAQKLYMENKDRILERFPKFFLREFENLSEDMPDPALFLDKLCIEKNTKKLYSRKNFYFDGKVYIREITDGGIFSALWAMCEDLEELIRENKKISVIPEECFKCGHVGCRVELLEIPLDQHVIEILEYLKESPYEVRSSGSWLIGCEEVPEDMPFLTEIGEITGERSRQIFHGDNSRFLTPPGRQAKDTEDRKRGLVIEPDLM